jgi:hypothetical protein
MAKLNVKAIGISNIAWAYSENKHYGLQFYDFDGFPSPSQLDEILSYFPFDVLIYRTRDGFHFTSFTLLSNLYIPKANSLMLSKAFNQDYWSRFMDLTLRISDKFTRWRRKTKSSKPVFVELTSPPLFDRPISAGHLEYYRKYMGLPNRVYDLYSKCPQIPTVIQLHFYKTRV